MLFENREHAARLMARRLSAHYKNKNPLVLAIPRGTIHMAEIIADTLRGEWDVVLVHKLGAPGQPELASRIPGSTFKDGAVTLSVHSEFHSVLLENLISVAKFVSTDHRINEKRRSPWRFGKRRLSTSKK
jgi:predicted phosphoribosyltransferase